jgi:hypothetical protein
MKKFKNITLVIVVLFCTINFAQNGNRYSFNSAYVEKTSKTSMSGIEIESTEKIYISGNKQVIYKTEKQNITMANIVTEKKSVSILDGNWIITYDPETKKGTKMKFDAANDFSNMSEEDMKKFAEQMGEATKTETKDIGTKDIAGKTCKGTEATTNMMGMKTKTTMWQYGNFIMQSVSEGSGTIIKEGVTKFEEGITVDPKVFLVPEDVEITEPKSKF